MITLTVAITPITIVAVERNDAGLTAEVLAHGDRPATFADADLFLISHRLFRVGEWELENTGNVVAPIAKMDDLLKVDFNDAITTTHDEYESMNAEQANPGDLVADLQFTEAYLLVGRTETELHLVGQDGSPATRPVGGRVLVARKL